MGTHVDTLVLGAGPTGIGAAWELQRSGAQDWLLLDAAAVAGGMATTEVDAEGFRWDLGGHVIHSHFPYFDEVMRSYLHWTAPRRGGWVRLQDSWCPTPIQHHLGNLREGRRIQTELGQLPAPGAAADLQEHYLHSFGPTLNDLFFAPYNAKQWAWPLSDLSHTWTSLRSGSQARNVPAPRRELAAAAAPSDTSRFPYPARGTGALWQALSDALPAVRQRYGARVVRVDLQAHRVLLEDGEEITYRQCVSSLPLSALLRMVGHERPDLAYAAQGLRYSSTHAVGLGFEGPLPDALADKTWIFSPDPAVPFHRATVLTNFSRQLSGEGRWSVLFEASTSPHRPLALDQLASAHLGALRSWGVDAEPVSVWSRYLELGYPLPFRGRDELLARLLPELEAHQVLSRGRFGGWRYESSNQDYAFMQGVEAVQALTCGRPESVFWPERPHGAHAFAR